ncbi:mechanosensitive ion channel family protein, partial [Patescibacteria group bacterium]|nr:mechanosensitive ion channel family protein [Patescibacteria group bacterium]
LAIGFGAKNLVSDLIAGFFFILENQFNIGDTVEVGGNKGKVVRLTLRTLTLRDEEKKTYIIPNSNIKYIVKYPSLKKKS